jgi:hypothetical protein
MVSDVVVICMTEWSCILPAMIKPTCEGGASQVMLRIHATAEKQPKTPGWRRVGRLSAHHDDTLRAADGVLEVGNFLGYWFIRKAMWASQASIKSNATSQKEFYAFMVSKGLVEQKELNALKKQIKEEMPDWLLSLGRYNDPEVDLEDVS